MPSANIVKTISVVRSPRVLQLEGLFDVPPTTISQSQWSVELPLDDRPWNIGLIVGPSGSGKTSVLEKFWPDQIVRGFTWSTDKSIVDLFPSTISIKQITELLSRVGFSSPPAWLRPYHALSNGQQFRVTIARALAETDGLFVMDEFTSIVDRTVAKIGSSAIAKTIRQGNRQFIAGSCHYDILEWLQPDWTYEPATNTFAWRSVRRRPDIAIRIRRVDLSAWNLFRGHHYLSAKLNRVSKCFVGFVEDQPAVLVAVLPFPHPKVPGWRAHRTVCLPDFQGVGIGNAMSNYVASIFAATGKPYHSVTSHPAMVRYRAKSELWSMIRKPSRVTGVDQGSYTGVRSRNRITAGFRYVGPANLEAAVKFGIVNASKASRGGGDPMSVSV